MQPVTMITRQNLQLEKARFAISAGGVALSVFLIAFLLSLFQGWNLHVGRFVEQVDTDLWIAREGTSDFLNASSILPASLQDEFERQQDVTAVDALIVRPMTIDVEGRDVNVHLVGYEAAGGPSSIEEGSESPSAQEAIVDEALARKAGLDIGDVLSSGTAELRVAGISSGGNLVFSQTVFVTLETAREMLSMEGLSTFYLIHLTDTADPTAVAEAFRAQNSGIEAFSSEEFTEATRSRITDNMIPILVVILALAFVVGAAITGLTIYAATIEKSREFGILKALGFRNSYLLRLVFEQSLITGGVGFAVGAILTLVAAQFVSDVVPEFVTLVRWQDILIVFVATLIMSLLAALLPVRRIAAVDPVAVFGA